MKIDPNNSPLKIASCVVKIVETIRVFLHGVTKIPSFEAYMGRRANTQLSNITTKNSPINLNWENAKHNYLDRKNLIHPPIPSQIMHDLQNWSEDEVSMKHKIPEPTIAKNSEAADNRPQTSTGVKTRRTLALEK